MVFKLGVLNLCGAAMAWVALHYAWVENPFAGANVPYLAFMFAVFACGLGFVFRGNLRRAEKVSNHLVTLGLLGTVLGLVEAFTGAAGADIQLRDLGVNTAFQTTIVGIVGHLWIVANLWAAREYT